MGIQRKEEDTAELYLGDFLKIRSGNNQREFDGQMGQLDFFKMDFAKAFYKNDYNKAEDLLFKQIKKYYSEDVYKLGMAFYDILDSKTNKSLEDCDFSREEVIQGKEDLDRIKNRR